MEERNIGGKAWADVPISAVDPPERSGLTAGEAFRATRSAIALFFAAGYPAGRFTAGKVRIDNGCRGYIASACGEIADMNLTR